ncbi:HAD family hydrolase, partial [Burkholderia sp. Se-20378]|nr:HAD family hydrolase [Burkholderia sp. Se-20378]
MRPRSKTATPDLPAPLRPRRVSRSRHRAGAPVSPFDLANTLHHASHPIFSESYRAMTPYLT